MRQRIEFGADGIRGKAGQWPIIPSVAFALGQAASEFAKRRWGEETSIVIGWDTRPSGIPLYYGLATGISTFGVNVIDLGIMTTPGVAFITRRLDASLGIVVSASHNDNTYNGFKVIAHNGLRLQREEEIEVEALVSKFIRAPRSSEFSFGQLSEGEHLIQLYIDDHIRRCPVQSLHGLNLVIDCANGAASYVAPEAFIRLGANVHIVHTELERKNINYRSGSEHARVCPNELYKVVKDTGADYAFAFDGDGDRLTIVDENGFVYHGNDLLYMLACYFREQGKLKNDAIVTTHAANHGLESSLKKRGIQTIYTTNGDKYIEAALWGGDYRLGGEPGGDIVINDGHHTAADAVYTALMVSGILAAPPTQKMQDWVTSFCKLPQISTSVIRENPLSNDQQQALEQLRTSLCQALGQSSQVICRRSTTEPDVYRIVIEGNMTNDATQIDYAVKELLQFLA